jgi:two-component system response regulator FlrC
MRLLIVGTLKGQLTSATKMAMDRGAAVTHAETNDQALAVLRGRGADLLMVDVALDIGDLVSRLELEHIHVPIVACGVENNARAAVDAIHAGAKEYIPLPPDPELIAAVLAAVADDSRDLIYRDDATAQVIKLATQIATSDASVLITGESGTGKEVLARYVHTRSNRSKKPFICVNCAAIPEHLLESELFGHEKGAFTGALERRAGCFELAEEGTILLDEIGEMPIGTQAKLLRVLEDHRLRRLGSKVETPINVRVLAATNKDPEDAVEDGHLRGDLFYRLNVFNLHMPPLREHKEDIPAIMDAMLTDMNDKHGRNISGIDKEMLARLMSYDWPGNVRELRNTIERAVILGGEGVLEARHLPPGFGEKPVRVSAADPAVSSNSVQVEVGATVDEAERRLILKTLESTRNNKTRAAEILGISLKTLHNKLKEYGSAAYAADNVDERVT